MTNDIRRLQNHCQYRLVSVLCCAAVSRALAHISPCQVRSFEIGCQQVLSMACINSFLSHLVLAAGSDRSVSVLDVGAEKVVHRFEEVHHRPVHQVALPQASAFASLPEDAYDLFLTASTDSSVQVCAWLVRCHVAFLCITGRVSVPDVGSAPAAVCTEVYGARQSQDRRRGCLQPVHELRRDWLGGQGACGCGLSVRAS